MLTNLPNLTSVKKDRYEGIWHPTSPRLANAIWSPPQHQSMNVRTLIGLGRRRQTADATTPIRCAL